ncbi:hypothetical protein ACNKHV_07865 [Shigella flexneri]
MLSRLAEMLLQRKYDKVSILWCHRPEAIEMPFCFRHKAPKSEALAARQTTSSRSSRCITQPKQDLLNDCIILCTGASDGIGREAAMTMARYGATVILLVVMKKNYVR